MVDTHHTQPDRLAAMAKSVPDGTGNISDIAERTSQIGVKGVTLQRHPIIVDPRGNLTVGEFARDVPFLPKRYFMVYGVPSRETRGEHAHRECHQYLICISGSCVVVVDDGHNRAEILLDDIGAGLHLPPMIWGTQYNYSRDAVLLVFASHYYDKVDYIRKYDEFIEAVKSQ